MKKSTDLERLQEKINNQNREILRLHQALRAAQDGVRELAGAVDGICIAAVLEYGRDLEDGGKEMQIQKPDVAELTERYELHAVGDDNRRYTLRAVLKRPTGSG